MARSMYDARIFTDTLENARKLLIEMGSTFKGEYRINDKIYASKDTRLGLEKTFLRLRHIPQNIWNEKAFIVAIKNTEILDIGKKSAIPVKKEFDTEAEAARFVEENYSTILNSRSSLTALAGNMI